jgi:hypothetical protein
MPDPYVREVGHIDTGTDGIVSVGVDYDTVAIYFAGWLSADGVRLTSSQAEDFAQLFVSACWQAAAQGRAMTDAERAELKAAAQEMCLADCGGKVHDEACREPG